MSESNGATTMNEEMSKELAAVLKPAPAAPKFFQIVPKNIQDLKTFAEMAAASDLVPKDYKGKAGNCFIAIQFGAELGIPPLQSLQNIAVINGNPKVYGDVGKALLLGKGFGIEERDIKEIEAKGEAWCKITRPRHMNSTNQPPTERTFSVATAKTAGVWGVNVHKTHPYRMLAWRAFWFCARDAAADVLKGIGGIEEFESYKVDAIDTTAVADAPKEIVSSTAKIDGKPVDVEIKTGEPTPAQPVVDVPPPDGLTPLERKELNDLMKANGVTPEIMREYLKKKFGITVEKAPSAFIRKADLGTVRAWIESPQDDLI